jgi:hypothetical protein
VTGFVICPTGFACGRDGMCRRAAPLNRCGQANAQQVLGLIRSLKKCFIAALQLRWLAGTEAQGTEMRAVIGALQEHIEREEDRLRREREEDWRRLKEEELLKLEQRFLSSGDCGWTAIEKSDALYSRRPAAGNAALHES